MVKMQIGCLIILIFIALLYFLPKRKRDRSDRIYSIMIIAGMVNLVFDILTVFTVNHLDSVPMWINDACHRIFIGSLLVFLFVVFYYIYLRAMMGIGPDKEPRKICVIPLALSLLGVWLGDLSYNRTTKGNYSSGIAPFMCYISVAIYIVLTFIILIYYRHLLKRKTIFITVLTLSAEILIAVYQLLVPTALVSGFGTTFLVLGYFLIVENPDIDVAQKLEYERNRASRANQAKSTFLARMSHEIRTPIGAILGLDEMILRESEEPETLEYAVDIQKAGRSLLGIINEILDISKIESGQLQILPEEYQVSSYLQDIVSMISVRANEKGLFFMPEIAENIPSVMYGDATKIRQVLVNLLSNAVKYTQEGTVVLRVYVSHQEGRKVWLRFSVEDTGMGIRHEDLEDIFRAFKRVDEHRNRKVEGTGLGLNISYEMLQRMGSELQVESRYGSGSTFSFELEQEVVEKEPIGNFRKLYETSQRRREQYKESFVAPNVRVLIVDDNDINRKVFRHLLKKTKIQITDVTGGRECLEYTRERHFDLIFMDHMMPDMDGIETFHHVREDEDSMCQDTPVVILTANAVSGAKDKYLEEGFDYYLTKPFDPIKLEAMIQEALPEEAMQRANPSDGGYGFDNEIMVEIREDFYNMIDDKVDIMKECIRNINDREALERFTIEVHSLKSSAILVDDLRISQLAEYLEKKCYERDLGSVISTVDELYSLLYDYKVKFDKKSGRV